MENNQKDTKKTINLIEALAKENPQTEMVSKTPLEESEGIGWSQEVLEEIEWRLEDAKYDLIKLAKQNSQWRSVIQLVFIILATISMAMVWLKLNTVAKKGML